MRREGRGGCVGCMLLPLVKMKVPRSSEFMTMNSLGMFQSLKSFNHLHFKAVCHNKNFTETFQVLKPSYVNSMRLQIFCFAYMV